MNDSYIKCSLKNFEERQSNLQAYTKIDLEKKKDWISKDEK